MTVKKTKKTRYYDSTIQQLRSHGNVKCRSLLTVSPAPRGWKSFFNA